MAIAPQSVHGTPHLCQLWITNQHSSSSTLTQLRKGTAIAFEPSAYPSRSLLVLPQRIEAMDIARLVKSLTLYF